MKPNLENLQQHYKNLSDEKLIELATLEVRNLHPEAIKIMQEEISSRGLSMDLLKGVDAQLQPMDEEKFLKYCALVQELPCPFCNSTNQKLTAAIVEKATGIGIATTHEKRVLVGCADCLKQDLSHGKITGLPSGLFGIIKMFSAGTNNSSAAKNLKSDVPNHTLRVFVWNNLGAIEANRENLKGLQELISPKAYSLKTPFNR